MKIVLPLDGSEFAETALPTAQGLARRLQGELVLVRVTSPILTTAPELFPSLGHEFSEQARGAALEYLKGLHDGEVHSLLGSPKEQIVQCALDCKADLLVLASHGRTGVARWLLGSTAEYVVRHSACPVLLLRPHNVPRPAGDFKHVLVPVDGSAAAREVVDQVAPYLATGGKVTILRASGLTARDYSLLNSPEEVRVYLNHLAEQLKLVQPQGLAVEHQVVDGEAADSILHFAHDHHCDLIAMSTHGRTGFRRFVLGSVTERVARHASCPVLAVPQKVSPV